MFILYINDLPDNLTHKLKLFANDVKLIVETDRDDDDMQCDINRKVKGETWPMELSPEKFKIMHLGKQNKKPEDYRVYSLQGKIFDCKCTFCCYRMCKRFGCFRLV